MSARHIKSVATEWEWEKDMPPAPAVRAGNTLYLSGQIALGANGEVVGEGDVIAQARQCFENIKAILKREGAATSDIVKMTTYYACPLTTDVTKEYWKVRAEYFGDYRPASTGVAVNALIFRPAGKDAGWRSRQFP
ncbi:RidA family protein [Aminobacter sp. HY435]|uniref:RidA family protein n=1 Tax=Aminobacter sp. HY435 TaxID=2970917 RepID=UPI0022B94DF3|nr:RidA family protein [Aminobacter sp. HY435]